MKRILSLALCLVLCLSLLPVSALAAGDVAINETNFPDKTVRSYVKYHFDTDGNDKLSAAEIKAAEDMTFGPEAMEITNLKGIELLTSLKRLSMSGSKITELDISKNLKLEELNLWFNAELTKLTVGSNTNLVNLTCFGSKLTAIDVSKNTKLEGLNVGGNQLTKLDLSNNTELKGITVSNNSLTKLDLSHNTKLTKLGAIKSGLKVLDVRACPALVENLRSGHYEHLDNYYIIRSDNAYIEADYNIRFYYEPDATITAQPKNVSAEDGTTASFTVKAQGSTGNLSYQWQYRTSAAGSWNNSSLSTAKASTLKVRATASVNGYQFRCKVTNGASAPVYSQPATLSVTVTQAPTISTQPKDAGATPGSTVSFTVKTPNSGVSYQWQYRTSATGSWNNSSLSTAKEATLTFKATNSINGYQYRCKVKNAVGTTISDPATLHVGKLPVITANPTDATAGIDKWAHFSVTAEGEGLSYQWQYRINSEEPWKNCSNDSAKTPNLSLRATSERGCYDYRCKVTNVIGSVFSEPANLNVVFLPEITTQSHNTSANVGEVVSFTVEAEGARSYQWQCRTSTSGGWFNSSLSTAKEPTLKIKATASVDGNQYRCKVTNEAGSVYSLAKTLTVITPIITQPQSVTASAGETVSFTVEAEDATSYQWQCRTSESGSWFNSSLSTAKEPTLKIKATASVNGYQYRCKVTNEAGAVYTDVVTLTVK